MCGVLVVDAVICSPTVLFAINVLHDLRYRHNFALSINCSTVICSPTVLFSFKREASSETMAPGSIFHHFFRSINPKT